jgi:hypothetical protein
MQKVKEFMLLPEILRYCAEFGAKTDDIEFKTDKRKGYLAYSISGIDVGMIDFHIETGVMAMFHPYILRKYKRFYDDMVSQFFEWFLYEVPETIVKLNVLIPVIRLGALAAAERAGMQLEGTDRLSYLSEKGPCDRALIGITREELT